MEALKLVGNKFKAFPQNLVMAEGVPFGQRYTYGATHPIQYMLDAGYFLSLRHQLRPGDTMRICQMDSINLFEPGNKVLAYIDVLVVSSERDGVVFHQETDNPIFMPLESGEESPEASPETASKYISGELKWCGKGHWSVIDDANKPKEEQIVYASGIEDKEHAAKIAAGEIPLPD